MSIQLEMRAVVRRGSRRDALAKLLADGQWHTSTELARYGGRRYGARVQELREGTADRPALDIRCEPVRGGPDGEYRWRAVGQFHPGENLDVGHARHVPGVSP